MGRAAPGEAAWGGRWWRGGGGRWGWGGRSAPHPPRSGRGHTRLDTPRWGRGIVKQSVVVRAAKSCRVAARPTTPATAPAGGARPGRHQPAPAHRGAVPLQRAGAHPEGCVQGGVQAGRAVTGGTCPKSPQPAQCPLAPRATHVGAFLCRCALPFALASLLVGPPHPCTNRKASLPLVLRAPAAACALHPQRNAPSLKRCTPNPGPEPRRHPRDEREAHPRRHPHDHGARAAAGARPAPQPVPLGRLLGAGAARAHRGGDLHGHGVPAQAR